MTVKRSLLLFFLLFSFYFLISSCSVQKQIAKQADTILLKDSAISSGHIGISIYEPATGRYWYEYDATKYFVPASNVKLFTLYAGMKYLGDSLVGGRLATDKYNTTLFPSGDPTFLDPAFPFQPLAEKLKLYKSITINNNAWLSQPLGNGWSWDDYTESDMTERSSFPVYKNLINFSLNNGKIDVNAKTITLLSNESSRSPVKFDPDTRTVASDSFTIDRRYGSNDFYIKDAKSAFTNKSLPFYSNYDFVADLLKDTFKFNEIFFFSSLPSNPELPKNLTVIHSQPSDSLFKPMMHRSDNFFAEQILLMVSNEKLGYMSDNAIIDTLLNTDLSTSPQKPKWVDGSGLSRYNLFTPRSFIYILGKMKAEFGMERMKVILATGGKGTLRNYYRQDGGFIFAKTGTLSNHCALSGYLFTKKGKLLIFSVLANHYKGAATPVRRAVERFINKVRNNY